MNANYVNTQGDESEDYTNLMDSPPTNSPPSSDEMNPSMLYATSEFDINHIQDQDSNSVLLDECLRNSDSMTLGSISAAPAPPSLMSKVGDGLTSGVKTFMQGFVPPPERQAKKKTHEDVPVHMLLSPSLTKNVTLRTPYRKNKNKKKKDKESPPVSAPPTSVPLISQTSNTSVRRRNNFDDEASKTMVQAKLPPSPLPPLPPTNEQEKESVTSSVSDQPSVPVQTTQVTSPSVTLPKITKKPNFQINKLNNTFFLRHLMVPIQKDNKIIWKYEDLSDTCIPWIIFTYNVALNSSKPKIPMIEGRPREELYQYISSIGLISWYDLFDLCHSTEARNKFIRDMIKYHNLQFGDPHALSEVWRKYVIVYGPTAAGIFLYKALTDTRQDVDCKEISDFNYTTDPDFQKNWTLVEKRAIDKIRDDALSPPDSFFQTSDQQEFLRTPKRPTSITSIT